MRRFCLFVFVVFLSLPVAGTAFSGGGSEPKTLSVDDFSPLSPGLTMKEVAALFGAPHRMEAGPFLAWPKQRSDVKIEAVDEKTWLGSGYWFVFEKMKNGDGRSKRGLKFIASYPQGVLPDKRALWDQVPDMTIDWPKDRKGQTVKKAMGWAD